MSTLRGKLLSSVGCLILGYVVFFAMVEWTTSITQKHLQVASDALVPAASSLQVAGSAFQKLTKSYKDAVMLQNAALLSGPEANAVRDSLEEARQRLVSKPALQAEVAQILDRLKRFQARAKSLYTQMIASPATFDPSALTPVEQETQGIDQSLNSLHELVGSKSYQVEMDAVTASNRKQAILVLGLFLFALCIGAVVLWIVRKLDGDLRRSILELSAGSDQVAVAASQLSASSQTLAQNTSDQTALIEETSVSTTQINAMARRNSASVLGATSLVAEAVQSTEVSNRAVSECVASMQVIGESSEHIAKIIDVIDRIAFQTNILALNAAVEAARAGQAGMGFAVVADEVRNLAQRSAQAAQETAFLVQQSVTNTNEGQEKIKLLVASGRKVTEVFARIKLVMDEIGQSSHEQGRGIEQIGRTITRMERNTQEGAASAQETAAASQQLNTQSDVLRHTALELGALVGV